MVWASAGAALGPDCGWFLAGALDLEVRCSALCLILIPLLILAVIIVPESKDPNPSPVDLLSILLIMTGMTGITFGLTHTSETGFDSGGLSAPSCRPCASLSCSSCAAQPREERYSPMLSVRLFRNTVFTGAITATSSP